MFEKNNDIYLPLDIQLKWKKATNRSENERLNLIFLKYKNY